MSSLPVGINYEGGKIAEYAVMSPFCLGYINAQIAMDAPFHDQIADESVRMQGRSEKSMEGYNEVQMLSEIDLLIKCIKDFVALTSETGEPLTVIQIARGRSAIDTITLITPLLNANCLSRYQIVTGYKSTSYFAYPSEPFVLLNIGMFGRLTGVETVRPGTIYNPTYTFDVVLCEEEAMRTAGAAGEEHQGTMMKLKADVPRIHRSKNLLHQSAFPELLLLGIDDAMPFVTPAEYNKDAVYRLIDTALNSISHA